MKKDKQTKEVNIVFWIILAGMIGILGGILIGIQIQQMVFIAGLVNFGESLEGTNIDVNIDFNETQLVEGMRDVFTYALNNTKLDKVQETNHQK